MTLAILDARDKEYVVVAAGTDLIATYVQQAIAAGQTAQEVLDAILAAGLSEGVFPSEAAGLSGTTDGQYFWVGSGGTVTLYLNDTGTGDEIAELATAAGLALKANTADLASPTGGEMVGVAGGGTVQGVIDDLGTVSTQDANDLDVTVSVMRRPGYYNWNSTSLDRWYAKLSSHRRGKGRAYIVCAPGNSIPAGVGTNPDDDFEDLRRRSWPSALAQILNSMPFTKATSQSLWGDGFFSMTGPGNLAIANPNVSWETGWTITLPVIGEQFVMGGHAFHDLAGNSGSPRFNFDPTQEDPTYITDSARVMFVTSPGYASAVITSDATFFAASQPTNAANGIVIKEITRVVPEPTDTPGWSGTDEEFFALPWTVQKAGGDSALTLTLVGIEAYNAADKPIGVYNMGASGSRIGHWVADNQDYSFINAIVALAPDLVIIGGPVNDYADHGGAGPDGSTAEATFKAEMRLAIEAALETASVLLLVDPPSNTGTATVDLQKAFAGYMRDLADEYEIPLIDIQEIWISQAHLADAGRYKDGDHPSDDGAWGIAEIVAEPVGNPGMFFG